ncbi:MAG: hypothetical protein V1695_00500 [Candidatus Uhrbacteria bacterium]
MSSDQTVHVTKAKAGPASKIITTVFQRESDLEPTLDDPETQRRQDELFDGSQRYRLGPHQPRIKTEQKR